MPSLRLDRLASLYVFHPLRGLGSSGGIPILMYHSISEDELEKVHPYYRTNTSVRIFREHMAFLHNNNYSVISLAEAVQFLRGTPPPRRTVVLTFDDGYQDFSTNAFPILQQYGFSATMFLPTRYIADTAERFQGKCFLTWAEVRELYQAGIQFGSHTVSHPQLEDTPPAAIGSELHRSKSIIEDKIGARIRSFSYPFRFPEQNHVFVGILKVLLQDAGYEVGVSTIIGRAKPKHDPLFLPRLPINSADDLALLRAKLDGGYDWLHVPQYLSKLRRDRKAPLFCGVLRNSTPGG